jgi:non-ribosomal peptide synthetase component E (peptide arylation enzyme)
LLRLVNPDAAAEKEERGSLVAKPTRYTPELIAEYTNNGYWTGENLPDVWDQNAREHPDKEAIVDSKTRLTWAQAKQWIDRFTLHLIKLGIKKDEVIAIQLPNVVELFLMMVACEKAGVLQVHLLRTMRHYEMEQILKKVEAVAMIIPWHFRDFDHFKMIQEIRPRLPALRHILICNDRVPEGTTSVKEMFKVPIEDSYSSDFLAARRFEATDVSSIAVTTGTTGLPKLIENPICAYFRKTQSFSRALRLTHEDTVAVMSAGLGSVFLAGFAGAPKVAARIVMQEKFDPEEALGLIEKESISVLSLVPAQAIMLARHPNLGNYDLTSLRGILLSGAPLRYTEGLEIEERLGCPVMQAWSSMDSTIGCMTSLDDPREIRLTTVGRPSVDGDEIKLVDDAGKEVVKGEVGEIWSRGPSGVSGYYKDPDATWQVWTRDGWFKSGDLGRITEEGNLTIIGRKTDIIIRGGQNISPVEIEGLLSGHPKVFSVAVIGMPDPILGERACAYVVPEPGQELTFEEMVSFLRQKRIAAYKLPERLEIMEELPLVAEQKVDKSFLRKDIAQKLKAEKKT